MRLVRALALIALAVSIPAAELKVALLCSGSTNDGGWNQLAKEGVDRLREELGAKVTVVQKLRADQTATELNDLAADGYQLVIAHGYEFLNPAGEAAMGLRGMRIAVSGADVEKPGIATLDFDVTQASYQLGIIAGRLTRTGKLGFVGGAPFPSVKACFRGFYAGARSVRPDVSVAEAYTSWDDVAKNKAQAEAFLNSGIDQIYPDVDAASRGVYEAVKEHNARRSGAAAGTRPDGQPLPKPDAPGGATTAAKAGTASDDGLAWTYGCVGDANANPAAGAWTLASAVIRLDKVFIRQGRQVQDGTWKPGLSKEDLASGTCVSVLNPRLMGGVITAELQAEVEAAGRKLAAGGIPIP